MFFNKKCCSSSALFSTFLSTTIQDDCKRRTLFRVFRGHVVFEGILIFLLLYEGLNGVVALRFSAKILALLRPSVNLFRLRLTKS